MHLDLFLIAQVEALRNYKNQIEIEMLVMKYRQFYGFAVDSGLDYDVDCFKEAQANLRRFIYQNKK
jgi:hypothetical protein